MFFTVQLDIDLDTSLREVSHIGWFLEEEVEKKTNKQNLGLNTVITYYLNTRKK